MPASRAAPPLLSLRAGTFRHSLTLNPPLSRRRRHASYSGTTSSRRRSANWKERIAEPASTHVFRSSTHNTYENLALEHYLLTHSHPTSRLLFLYTNAPSVVIGRNQNPWLECDLRRMGEGVPLPREEEEAGDGGGAVLLVRRRSGGGTVFHDTGNLNYSVIVPNDKAFVRRKHAEMVVRAIQRTAGLELVDVSVNERNDIVMTTTSSSADAVTGKVLKISGSAFKLTRGRALHHGTLLFSSPYLALISDILKSPAREYITAKGVQSVRSPVGNLCYAQDLETRTERGRNLETSIVQSFGTLYGDLEAQEEVVLGSAECDEDEEIAKGLKELMSPEWIFEQTPLFDFERQWGNARVRLQVKGGIIQSAGLNSHGESSQPAGYREEELAMFLVGKKLREVNWEETPKASGDGSAISTPPAVGLLLSRMFPLYLGK